MKLSISNIAWDVSIDDGVGELLRQQGVSAVEIAPTKYWPAPCVPSKQDVTRVRHDWQRRGQKIVAMQSLLYGREDLSIFGDESMRGRTRDYLSSLILIAEQLGARVLVFGSPRNRDRGKRSHDQAILEAADFFRPLAARAADAGVVFGFEPNPERYGCNFCTTTAEAMRLVDAVGHPGFALNLDTAIAYINREDFGVVTQLAQSHLVHVHISEPELAAIGSEHDMPHLDNAVALRQHTGEFVVSIEMRGGGNELDRIRQSIALTKEFYDD